MFIVMTNFSDGISNEVVHIGCIRHIAEKIFIEACAANSDWESYTVEYAKQILDDGYEVFEDRVVTFIDTSNCRTDVELCDELRDVLVSDLVVVEVVQSGEIKLDPGMTLDEVMEQCGANLDAACSWDIQGQILFKGSDGEWYTITTESTIARATDEFVKVVLDE